MFLSNPKHVDEITNAKIVQNDQIIKTVSLHKNSESGYSSDPFVVPSGEFKIFIEGSDSNKNPILREYTVDVIQNLIESITVKGENPSLILGALDVTLQQPLIYFIPNKKEETLKQPPKFGPIILE
jgi:hypothetical protein